LSGILNNSSIPTFSSKESMPGMKTSLKRPELQFIPISTDAKKIQFFGTLMPALLLLKASPLKFAQYQVEKSFTPKMEAAEFIETSTDDASRTGNILVFIHRWQSNEFDPFTFARAKVFLLRLKRLLNRAGYSAELIDPLSPSQNLPILAEAAGLGNLSPYGMLVHPIFGPRVILTGMVTDAAFTVTSRWGQAGCDDCMVCLRICPQKPMQDGVIQLRLCQSCAKCFTACPTGKTKSGKLDLA
jgi:epoxyqueuosine reductase